MHPSTKRTATIGGFVAGGSGGIGSVTYGGLREHGNILAARVVTVEEEPRVIELRGDAAQKINRAYGTTGIITALEIAARARLEMDRCRGRVPDDFIDAAAFGYEAASPTASSSSAARAGHLAAAVLFRRAETLLS